MKRRLSLLLTLCLVLVLCTPMGSLNAAVTYKLNASSRTLNGVGKKYTLKLTAPKGTTAAYRSSNSKVASVTSKGVVTAQKKGSAIITCTAKKGSVTKRLTCVFTVKVPAKEIKFTNAVIDSEYDAHILELGNTFDFNALRISSSTKSSSTDVIRFYVKDESKATVDAKTGVVTPLKAGFTSLTVSCAATAKKALNPENKIKQTINLFIVKPTITVTSCNLMNLHDLQIDFSHSMMASSLLSGSSLASGISIKEEKNATELGTLTGKLSDDKKTLIITNSKAFSGTYTISLKKSILSESGYPLTPYTESKELKDNINPTYLGCSLDDTGLIVSLNFSEPISITNIVPSTVKRADNVTLRYTSPFTTKSNYKLSKDQKSILLDLTSIDPSDRNVPIEVTLYGIVDLANNPTNPYPLVASIYTNTTGTTQAKLQSAYRNGNSIVAVFDKSMQIPGYAIANNNFLNGEVNQANKKEIIYRMSDTSLLNNKSNMNVVFYNYSTYNAGSASTSASRIINFSAPAALPAVVESSFTTNAVNSISTTTLTLTFNETVVLLAATGQISCRATSDGIVGANTKYTYKAEADGKTVTLTFQNAFTEQTQYAFTLPQGFVMDCYYNYNQTQSVRVMKAAGEKTALPGPTSIQADSINNDSIYISFPTMLDQTTAETKENYKISGVAVQSAQLISNTYGCPAIVKLSVPQNSIIKNAPYQITINGIKGYKDSYTTMKEYKTMITLSNNQTLEIQNITAFASNNSVTLIFSTPLTTSTPTTIDYVTTMNTVGLTVKSVNIKDTMVTITYKENLIAGQTLLLKPTSKNYLTDINKQQLLNMPLSVIVA